MPRARRASPLALAPGRGEAGEQRVLAQWLQLRRGVLWAHVPNGGHRHIAVARAMKSEGVQSGVPDLLIFTPPPRQPEGTRWVGCALELKAVKGGRVSPMQQAWLGALEACGWRCLVCRGAAQAIQALQALGY